MDDEQEPAPAPIDHFVSKFAKMKKIPKPKNPEPVKENPILAAITMRASMLLEGLKI
eukprot:CAMPEP_0202961426 /NCGR_PEP_ID=MMETSP1396-20130829/5477_1 /ASSEMBLY_ACC=CAM_ASM_000872 /TAXON_ID= /ORGANISM="Pseudokeronopsis sp., Strain Brazil" /LENGTH=56 /DNA_ID=CAMNT_0049681225 /DNA_START=493 /DNA_END=663 /DNA_ORIENTATION=+